MADNTDENQENVLNNDAVHALCQNIEAMDEAAICALDRLVRIMSSTAGSVSLAVLDDDPLDSLFLLFRQAFDTLRNDPRLRR